MAQVQKLSGREFEKKILGRNGNNVVIHNKKDVTFNGALRKALKFWDGETLHPNTDEANVLYYRTKNYLTGLKVNIRSLALFSVFESAADILYQTDAVFYLVTESGNEYLATLDLSFSSNPEVKEKFATVTNDNYLDTQSQIYLLKRGQRFHWPEGRPENHFLLTQFDVLRPRGLKTLSREIAHSLFRQVVEREGKNKRKEV